MVEIPVFSVARQVKICATAAAGTGSSTRRVLVRPWAALTGTGCGKRQAAYPYGGRPMFHPASECSRSPCQAFFLICNRNHSATPCLTRRIKIVVGLMPSTSIGSSVANKGTPQAASSFSSLIAFWPVSWHGLGERAAIPWPGQAGLLLPARF